MTIAKSDEIIHFHLEDNDFSVGSISSGFSELGIRPKFEVIRFILSGEVVESLAGREFVRKIKERLQEAL